MTTGSPGPAGQRVLTIMGSGETSPTMVKVHRSILQRFGPPPVAAVMLDTPFGFQENVDELCAKAAQYFSTSLNNPLEIASYRSTTQLGSVAHEETMVKLRNASLIFAGPGSPTYALRQWQASLVPQILDERLRDGGAVTFASAAAVTLGSFSAPIYEIYKVGEDPRWIAGMGTLTNATGLNAAVIPHYNNAEGGTHDTRYCYLGETRLSDMEQSLPPGCFVLGIDEHTGVVFDLEEQSASVVGIGVLTIRCAGRSVEIENGETVDTARIASIAAELGAGPTSHASIRSRSDETLPVRGAGATDATTRPDAGTPGVGGPATASPFARTAKELQNAFEASLGARDIAGAIEAAIALENEIAIWSTETFSANERELARSALHGMIISLGELAKDGVRDPREAVAPFVEGLLEMRSAARTQGRYSDADYVRDLLVSTGVEVRDGADGTEWSL